MVLKGREFDLRRVTPVKRREVSGRARFQRFEEMTVMRPAGAAGRRQNRFGSNGFDTKTEAGDGFRFGQWRRKFSLVRLY
jgi:hypothetical protein